MHVNKVSRVRTIDRLAKDLGEDVDFLFDVAIEMEPEDGLIRVLSLGDESVMAFTDDGVDSLVELVKIHRETKPREECCSRPRAPAPAAYAGRLRVEPQATRDAGGCADFRRREGSQTDCLGLFQTAQGPRALDLAVVGEQGRGTPHCRSRQRLNDRAGAQKNILQPHRRQCWVIPPKANGAFVAAMEDVLAV